jgi:hypothetical protein
VFTGGERQIIGRFSVFAGVPTLPDNDDAAPRAPEPTICRTKSPPISLGERQ